ncbi:MAG: hypothetical protein V4683_02965 [Bacteroidota bacterium]
MQLNFLGNELKNNNLGERMQELFPEGFVFINALYGLSWCELAFSDSTNDKKIKAKALKEALFAYNEINSDKAKSIFDSHLTPEKGIFYIGWNNYLLSKILSLDTSFVDYDKYENIFIDQSELISNSLKESNSPFLQSYHNQTWPADMFVAMASISNYDKIFKPKYKNEISEWINGVKLNLDPKTKLIPHKVNPRTGGTIEGPRGSSISLIIRLLAEIEPNFANEQYELYKTNFVITTLGLPSICEYPKGQFGETDIDSGPVIFGVGFSGTIVSIGTYSMLGDSELAEMQYKTINAFGFSNKFGNEKKYIFGLLPIADAFIAWGRASGLNQSNISNSSSNGWRVKFHIISFLVLTILWLLLYSNKIISKFKELAKESK